MKVISLAGRDKFGNAVWNCLCECGARTLGIGHRLEGGHKRSCGCSRLEWIRDAKRTHGQSRKGAKNHREYLIWSHMKDRCYNKKNAAFKNYGGRGISICERWRNSFAAFLNDMGTCPVGLTLNRVDNDGDYKPSNCNWTTYESQNRNRRDNVNLKAGKISKTITEWSRQIGLSRHAIRHRLSRGWSVKQALFTGYRQAPTP